MLRYSRRVGAVSSFHSRGFALHALARVDAVSEGRESSWRHEVEGVGKQPRLFLHVRDCSDGGTETNTRLWSLGGSAASVIDFRGER